MTEYIDIALSDLVSFFAGAIRIFCRQQRHSPSPTMIPLTNQYNLLLWSLGPILDVFCRNKDPWKAKNRLDTLDFAAAANIFNPMKMLPTLKLYFYCPKNLG